MRKTLPSAENQSEVLGRQDREEQTAGRRGERALREERGWKVIRIWEHDLKSKDFEFDFEDDKAKEVRFSTREKKNELKAVDFFSGAGGLTHGLKSRGNPCPRGNRQRRFLQGHF